MELAVLLPCLKIGVLRLWYGVLRVERLKALHDLGRFIASDRGNSMKKFLLGTIGLVALGMAAPASAADLRARPAPPPPMVAAIYDWSGFYIGGNGGWGQSRNCVDFVTFADACSERSGGLAGGQLGYRWQAGTWVFGLEGQGDWADLSNTRVSIFRPEFSTRTKTDGIGLFTGQIGWAWNTALFYVKGGAA